MQNKKMIWVLLIAILIAAFTIRITKIDSIPSSIYPDEAQNGIDAQEANASGNYKWFYDTNNGREGLFINIQAISIKYVGNTELGLKLPSIVFGTLTVLGIFLLVSELFQSQIAGLVGAYMITFSYWAINFSRIGFRAIMVPFILTFAFYFLFKGLRTKKIHNFLSAGLIYGLGLHTYIAFRVSPLVLIVLFIALAVVKKHFIKEYWKHTLVFTIAMFITSAPMMLDFFYYHPEHYASRTSEISVLNPNTNQGHLIPMVAKTFGLSLAKYNFWGDQNMRHNYAPYPLLNPLTGITFLAGIIYITLQFFRLTWQRFRSEKRDTRLILYTFLLSWFLVLLIPEFLAAEGNPHALRSIGNLPVVIIISVIPFIWIFRKYHSFGHSFRIFIISIFIFGIIFVGLFDSIKYFVFFNNSPQQHQAFEANLGEVSKYIQSLPSSTEKYVITGNMQRLPLKYLDQKIPNLTYPYPEQANEISPTNKNNFVMIFTDPDWNIINSQRDRFANIKFEQHTNSFGDTFYTLNY